MKRSHTHTYLYKLQCWDAPPHLKALIPPELPRPPPGATRASKLAHASWHAHNLLNILAVRNVDNARRALPFCMIDEWNSLPAWFFDNGFELKHLQTFAVRVHNFFGGKAVFNPALGRLRGRQARRATDSVGDAHGHAPGDGASDFVSMLDEYSKANRELLATRIPS